MHPSRFPFAATLAAAVAALPLAAQAQVFKCKTADGSTSYQSAPCPNSRPPAPAAAAAPTPAARSDSSHDDPYAPQNADKRPTLQPPPARTQADNAAPLPPVTPSTAGNAPMTDRERLAQYERQRAVQTLARDVAQVKAKQKAAECAGALQQLGRVKDQRPIYVYDRNGNRVYAQDKDSAVLLALARERASEACN